MQKISYEDRVKIEDAVNKGLKQTQIADMLKLNRSTICRELKRANPYKADIADNTTVENDFDYDLYNTYKNVNQMLFNQNNAQQTESNPNANTNNNIENYIANIEKADNGSINALQKDTRKASTFEKDLFDFVTNAPTNAVDSEDFANSLNEITKKHPGESDTIINAASAVVNNTGNDFLNDYFGENLSKIDFSEVYNDNQNAEQLKYNANLNGENVEIISANGDNVTVKDAYGQEQTVKNSDLQTTEGGQAAIDVAKTYGKKGSALYLGNLTSNVRAYTNSFNTFYNAGRNGTDFGDIQATNYDNLSNDSKKAMQLALEIYYAGSADSGTNSKVGGLVRNENRHKIDERVARTLNACGKAFGVTIELDGKISHDANGVYEDGRIHISLDTDNPVAVVLAHEFTHRLKQTSPDAYKNYEKYVIDALKAEGVYEERAGKLKLAYEKQGVKLSDADVNEELAANASETFLMDEDFVNDIVTKDRNLAEQILDAIQKLIDDIKAIIVKDYQAKSIEAKVISEYAEGKYLKEAQKLWKTAIEQQDKSLMAKENAKGSEGKYLISDKNALKLKNLQNNYTEIALNDKAIVLDHPYKSFKTTKERYDYLDQVMSNHNNSFYNDNLSSKIIYDKQAKKDLIRHNISRMQSIYDILPQIIEQGKPIQYINNRKGDGRNYVTIAAPVKFNIHNGYNNIEKDMFVGISFAESLTDNRLHMVNVETIDADKLKEGYADVEMTTAPSLENPVSASSVSTDDSYPSINTLLQHLVKIKLQDKNDKKYSLKESNDFYKETGFDIRTLTNPTPENIIYNASKNERAINKYLEDRKVKIEPVIVDKKIDNYILDEDIIKNYIKDNNLDIVSLASDTKVRDKFYDFVEKEYLNKLDKPFKRKMISNKLDAIKAAVNGDDYVCSIVK